jgi:xanthine dehydrogenase molybdenum-binding subunit
LLAPYRIPHADITGEAVYTNTPVTGAFRGYGGPQACFPLEHMIDLGCRELGVDPLAVRELMRIREGDIWRADMTIQSDGFGECLERGAEAIDWRAQRERGPVADGHLRRGVGMACTVWGSGSGSHPGSVE